MSAWRPTYHHPVDLSPIQIDDGPFTEQEDLEILQFAAMTEETDVFKMWLEYRKQTQSARTASDLSFRFRHYLLPNIPLTRFLNVHQQLKICKKFQVKIDHIFYKQLSQSAEVSINEHGHISSFKLRSIPFSALPASESAIWTFLLQNLHRSDVPVIWENCRHAVRFEGNAKMMKERFYGCFAWKLEAIEMALEQKLKLYKGYRIPIEKDYVEELKSRAEITLSNNTVFNFHLLKHPEAPTPSPPPAEKEKEAQEDPEAEEKALWQYIAENYQKWEPGLLWMHYKEHTNSRLSYPKIKEIWTTEMAPYVHLMDFDVKTKLGIYKKFEVKVDERYLEVLKKHAKLRMNNGVIMDFEMESQSQSRKAEESKPTKQSSESKKSTTSKTLKRIYISDSESEYQEESPEEEEDDNDEYPGYYPGKHFTDEEDAAMFKFFLENFRKYGPFQLWTQFKKETKAPRLNKTYHARCLSWIYPRIHLADCDIKMKLEIYKTFRIPVNKSYRKTLEKHATVEFDRLGKITDYSLVDDRSKYYADSFLKKNVKENTKNGEVEEGSEESEAENQNWPKPYSEKEKSDMWKFFLANFRKYGPTTIWKVFKEKTKGQRSKLAYRIRCKAAMYPKIHEADCDMMTKLEIYKKFRIRVDKKFLEELKKHAKIELDGKGKIIDFSMKGEDSEESEGSEGSDKSGEESEDQEEPEEPEEQEEIIIKPKRARIVVEEDYEVEQEENSYSSPWNAVEYEDALQNGYEPEEDRMKSPEPDEIPDTEIKREIEDDEFLLELGDDEPKDRVPVVQLPIGPFYESLKQMISGAVQEANNDLVEKMRKDKMGQIKQEQVEKSVEIPQKSAPNLKDYLTNLKNLLIGLDSPELNESIARLDEAIQGHSDDEPLPFESIRASIDVGLQMIGD